MCLSDSGLKKQLTDNGVIAASSLLKCADGAEVRCDEFVQEAELNPWLDVSYLSRKRKKAQAIIEEIRQVFLFFTKIVIFN